MDGVASTEPSAVAPGQTPFSGVFVVVDPALPRSVLCLLTIVVAQRKFFCNNCAARKQKFFFRTCEVWFNVRHCRAPSQQLLQASSRFLGVVVKEPRSTPNQSKNPFSEWLF